MGPGKFSEYAKLDLAARYDLLTFKPGISLHTLRPKLFIIIGKTFLLTHGRLQEQVRKDNIRLPQTICVLEFLENIHGWKKVQLAKKNTDEWLNKV